MAFAIWSRLAATRVRSLCTTVAKASDGASSSTQREIASTVARRVTSTALWWPVLVRQRQTGVFEKLDAGEFRMLHERIARTASPRMLNRSQFRNGLAISADAHNLTALFYRFEERR